MANTKRTDVELVISATNEATKTIDEIVSSFDQIEESGKGVTGFFKKVGQSSEELEQKQKSLVDALNQAKDAQKQLGKVGSDRDKSLTKQSEEIDKLKVKLQELKAGYDGYAKAASTARTPGEYLTEQLQKQKDRFASLAESIQATRQKLAQSESTLEQNQGVDSKADQNITKQREKVIELGKAWRDAGKAVREAQAALTERSATSDVANADAKSAKQRLDDLRAQVKVADQLEKAKRKELKETKKASKEQVKALLDATRNTKKLREERDQQNLVERELRNQAKQTNKEYNDQQKVVDRLVTNARKQKEAYESLKNSLVEYEKAQKSSGTERQEANIERLRKTLERLETQYENSGNSIANTQKRIDKASAPDPGAIKKFNDLKSNIEATEEAIKREVQNLEKMNREFDEAGISAEKLGRAEKKLKEGTDRLTQEQKKLEQQLEKTGGAAGKAGKSAETFNKRLFGGNGSRQSLSYLQRIRGELLSIAATYTGLYAVGGGVRSIYDAAVLTQKATSRLSARFNGDMGAVGEEIKFVRAEAERLGLEFETLLDEYTKFISNIPEGTLNLEQIRFTFGGIAEAARVVGLNTEDVKATFRALGQIASKGALQLEELKGQLGERIPKAVESAANGISDLTGELVTTEELLKRINKGEVTSDAIVAIAKALKDEFGPELTKSMESPQVGLNDFKNTLFELREDLAKSGFLDELIKGLKEVAEVMKTPEFKEGAKDFAKGLSSAIKFAVKGIEHFDTLSKLILGIIGLKVIKGISGIGKTLFDFGKFSLSAVKGTRAFATSVGGLKKVLGGLKVALTSSLGAVAAAGTAGFGIGTALYKNIPEVKKFGITLIAEFDKMTTKIGGLWDRLKFRLKSLFSSGLTNQGALKQMEVETQKEVDAINDQVTQMFNDIDDKFNKNGKGDGNGKNGPKILDPKEAKSQAKEFSDEIFKGLNIFRSGSNFEGLQTQFKNIGEALENESANTLQARLELIEKEYAAFLKELGEFQVGVENQIVGIQTKAAEKIAQVRGSDINQVRKEKEIAAIRTKAEGEIKKLREQQSALSGASSKTNQLIQIRKSAEIEKDNEDRSQAAQEKITALVDERKDKIERINELEELSLIDSEQAALRIREVNDSSLTTIRAAVEEGKKLAKEIGNSELADFTEGFDGFEELERRRGIVTEIKQVESEINEMISIRDAKIAAVNTQRELGVIAVADAEVQVRDLSRETAVAIREAYNEAIKLAAALGDDQLVEKLKAAQGQVKVLNKEVLNATQVNQDFASGLTDAIDEFANSSKSAKDAFKDFVSDFLRNIGKAILQALILKAITGSLFGGGGGIGGLIAGGANSGVNAAVNHTGGIVGKDGARRTVPAWLFANAIRYHSGGIAGLKPDEVPTILQKGEQVIPKDQVGKQNQQPQEIKIVNAIDSASIVNEGLSSSEGTKAVLNMLRANKSQVKSVLA